MLFPAFAAHHDAILAEARRIAKRLPIKRDRGQWASPDGLAMARRLHDVDGWITAWTDDDRWLNFPLVLYGECFRRPAELCPVTARLMRELGTVVVGGFSLLLPGAVIPPHTDAQTGPRHGRMAYHYGLSVPEDGCYLIQGDAALREADGKELLFDGATTHCAVNATDRPRLILYMDVYTDVGKRDAAEWAARARCVRV